MAVSLLSAAVLLQTLFGSGVQEEEEPEVAPATPYEYLYAEYPEVARRMDCVITRESRWTSQAQNRSGATGLAQFIYSTWMTTPQGKAGLSRFDPYANIDGAVWLAKYSPPFWRHWTVVRLGYC